MLQKLVSSWPLSFLLVNFRLLFICLVVCYVVKLEGSCAECMWEGVKSWDTFWLGALFEFFLVSGHLLSVLLSFSLFLGSLFLWCFFLPFFLFPLALRRRGGIVVDWCLGRTKSSVISQGGHLSPSQSPSPAVPPIFPKARDLGSLFSVWASPCEPVATFDISCFHVVFFPSCFWPLSFLEKRWDCCGLVFRKDEK